MKKQIILLAALFITSANLLAASVSGSEIVTQTRSSKPYSFVHVTGEMNIRIVQDEKPGLVIEGTEFQVNNTITILRNDTLFVFQINLRKGDKPHLVINVNDLVGLEVSGKTNVDCSGLINSDYLTVRAMDGAQIKLNVRALKVDSKATGSSFISLSGNTFAHASSTEGDGKVDSHFLDVMQPRESTDKLCLKC